MSKHPLTFPSPRFSWVIKEQMGCVKSKFLSARLRAHLFHIVWLRELPQTVLIPNTSTPSLSATHTHTHTHLPSICLEMSLPITMRLAKAENIHNGRKQTSRAQTQFSLAQREKWKC